MNFSLTSETEDPTMPTTLTKKQIKLSVLRTTHFLVQAPMFFCRKYISIGKYIARGQKLMAPNNPRTELKYGKAIASPVVDTTYNVRKKSLNKLIRIGGRRGCFKV